MKPIGGIPMILLIFSKFAMDPAIVRPLGARYMCQYSFCIIPGTSLENAQYRFLIFCFNSEIHHGFDR